MKYFCTNCNYCFDEAIGDEIEELKPGTKIEKLEFCPQCLETDAFILVNEEANYLDEFSTDLKELEHFIEIEKIQNGQLKIIISDGEHPMEENHKISSVSIFDEYSDLVEEKFILDEEISEIFFSDYDLDIFEIRIKCNKHGVFARKFENF